MAGALADRGANRTRATMYLNRFADTTEPLDMTATEEFRSLLASAADLGIAHAPDTAYRSRNIVLRQLRFHYLEWGAPDAPPIVLLHGTLVTVPNCGHNVHGQNTTGFIESIGGFLSAAA